MYDTGYIRARVKVIAIVLKSTCRTKWICMLVSKALSIMHFQAILIHHRARIPRELEQVTQTSLDRFDSQSCIEAASNENNRAYHFTCLLHRHLLYDWRRNKSGITIYAHIWHLSIALITLWYFIDFSRLCDGLIFYSSVMKNEYQDYSVSALSYASHSIHILLY